MSAEIREEVLKLMQEKDKIEVEIKELTAILTHVNRFLCTVCISIN